MNKFNADCIPQSGGDERPYTEPFATYAAARRVLLLDPREDLQYKPKDWWAEVFSSLIPPAEIDEICSGVFDWVDDESRDWRFERLKP